jgi:hypothetical protein
MAYFAAFAAATFCPRIGNLRRDVGMVSAAATMSWLRRMFLSVLTF